MKIESSSWLPYVQPWRNGLYLVAYRRNKKEVEEGNDEETYESDMVIAKSDSDADISAAIEAFKADEHCFDNIINGVE